ncbi:hypothetical protein FDECE_15407 [Fusarium decemcellulare]|nr:hypothetical protein FDECE_15407 [Fusarium decemcellulare]
MQSYPRSISSIELSPPENAYLYLNRPLPATPTTPSRSSSRAKPAPTRRFSAFPKTTGPGNNPKELPQQPPVVVPLALSRRRASRMSVSGASTLRERRSSQKIQQLTGHDVGAPVDWNSPPTRLNFSPAISPKSIRDDSSSSYSFSLDEPIFDEPAEQEDYQPRTSDSSMPPLEPDCDSMVSNQSFTAPASPKTIQRSSSLRIPKTRRLSTATTALETVPDLETIPDLETAPDLDEALDEAFDEDASWQARQSYNYFTDNETADEYHRIATRLANNDKRQSIYGASMMAQSQSSLTSRLSISAKSLFSRKRDASLSVSSSRTSLTAINYPTKGPYSPSIPPPSDAASVISPPRSIFETDDEEEFDGDNDHMREAIKDFFVRRSEERTSVEMVIPRSLPRHLERPEQPHQPPQQQQQQQQHHHNNHHHGLFGKTGVQVRDLFARGERRRTQLRSHIRMIPEEETGR